MSTKVKDRKLAEQDWRVGLSDDELRDLLHMMKLCRYFDERMEALYRQGKLPGAIDSGRGQEGTHVGTAFALRPEDSLFPTHRDLSAQLVKGLDLKRVMAQFWGRIDGYTRGRDGNSHLGDWEGAYSMPGVRVDAQDVLDVYEAAHEAAERARSGNGPTLFETVSLRWRGHAGHDPAKYVPQAMLEEYMTYRDPVKRFQELLLALDVIDEDGVKDVEGRIKKEFDEGFEFAQSSPLPRAEDVTKG